MQFFATDKNAPRNDVCAGIVDLEIAIADEVSDAVNNTGREYGDPQHLNCPYGQANGAEQDRVDDQHQSNASHVGLAIDVALYPVVRSAVPVLVERLLLGPFLTI